MSPKEYPHHLASEPVAPLFANAVSAHYFQQSVHWYLSEEKKPMIISAYVNVPKMKLVMSLHQEKTKNKSQDKLVVYINNRNHTLVIKTRTDYVLLHYLQQSQLSREWCCFCLQCLYFPLQLSNVSHLPFLWPCSWLPVCPDPIYIAQERKNMWFQHETYG